MHIHVKEKSFLLIPFTKEPKWLNYFTDDILTGDLISTPQPQIGLCVNHIIVLLWKGKCSNCMAINQVPR